MIIETQEKLLKRSATGDDDYCNAILKKSTVTTFRTVTMQRVA